MAKTGEYIGRNVDNNKPDEDTYPPNVNGVNNVQLMLFRNFDYEISVSKPFRYYSDRKELTHFIHKRSNSSPNMLKILLRNISNKIL